MWVWRVGLGLGLVVVLFIPSAWPWLEVVGQGPPSLTGQDVARFLDLGWNTLLLVAGTLGLALPLGVIIAFLLFRTDLPLRFFFRFLFLLALFIPLPVQVSAWQALLGADGLFFSVLWPPAVGRPWVAGLGPAIWVHALAALPWMVLFVGQGLCWVEEELEEESLLAVGFVRVWWAVTLPRCRGMILLACLWTALFTAGEISVTDMMQVPTLAEEVHLQFSAGDDAALARVAWLSLPQLLLTWIGLVWLAGWFDRFIPPLMARTRPPRPAPLGKLRWPLLILFGGLVVLLAGIPIASLVWKLGFLSRSLGWSGLAGWERLQNTFWLSGHQIGNGLLQAGLAGILSAFLAWVCCWAAQACSWFRLLVLSLAVLPLAMPGPWLGIGLKEMILQLVDWFPESFFAAWFYYQPSPLPGIWAYFVHFFPCALALLWPILRLVPQELYETVRLERGRPSHELRLVVWPLTWPAVVWTSAVVAGLALGEITVSNRVEPPRSETFAHLVFDRMHYGVDHEVAAPCLVLLLQILLLGLLLVAGRRLLKGRRKMMNDE